MEARLLGVQAQVAPGQPAAQALRALELHINDHKVAAGRRCCGCKPLVLAALRFVLRRLSLQRQPAAVGPEPTLPGLAADLVVAAFPKPA